MRYIISYPNPHECEDRIKRHLTINYEKYNKFHFMLLLNLLMPSNQNKYIRIQRSSYRYRLCLPNAYFFPKLKNIKEQLYSQVLETRITFVSCSKSMTFDFHLKRAKKSMFEWKLIEKLDKNPILTRVFNNQNSSHPVIRDYRAIDRDDFFQDIDKGESFSIN